MMYSTVVTVTVAFFFVVFYALVRAAKQLSKAFHE